MNQTVKVKSHSLSNGWFNLETDKGKVSVLAEKNPKLKSLLEANPDGNFDMPCSFVQKGDKQYAWDAKEAGSGGGGWKGGAPRSGNESFALAYSRDWHVEKMKMGKEQSIEDVLKTADIFFKWLEEKRPK